MFCRLCQLLGLTHAHPTIILEMMLYVVFKLLEQGNVVFSAFQSNLIVDSYGVGIKEMNSKPMKARTIHSIQYFETI